MKLIKQSFTLESDISGEDILQKIEYAGRTCYKSEDKITPMSATRFVATLIKSGHHSVLEHHSLTARIITNRGVTHEIVRHRLAAYSQESTRYVNYGNKDMEFILPIWMYDIEQYGEYNYPCDYWAFLQSLMRSEIEYNTLLQAGWFPQQAREILPNALKTEIVMTCNLREWRHIFYLRSSKAAHPQMRALMLEGLRKMHDFVPVIFDDLAEEYLNES